MDKPDQGELRLLAPAEMKPRMDRLARLAQKAAADADGVKLSRRHALGIGGLGLLALVGCGGSGGESSSSAGAAAASDAAGKLAGKPMEDRLLIYNFSDYLDPKTIKGFKKANAAVTVKETYYSSTDELEAKIKAGGGNYDVIVPGQNSIAALGQAGHLYELDKKLLPNFANLQPQWTNLDYDKGNTFSVVKNWGYTGFYYRHDVVSEKPKTWAEFFELLPKYSSKGRTNMLKGTTLIIGGAMIALGMDPDSENQADYDKAVKFLEPLAKHIKTLDATTYSADSEAGKIILGQGWSGDIVNIVKANKDVTGVAPDGPAERWADNWCIPADAPHPVAAHAWLNHLMDPQVALTEMEFTGYPTPNAKTWELEGAKKFRDDELINVPESKLGGYKFIISPTPKVLNLRQQAYEKFRATR